MLLSSRTAFIAIAAFLTQPDRTFAGGLLLHQQMGAEGQEHRGQSQQGGQAPAREVSCRAVMVRPDLPCAGPEDTEAQAGAQDHIELMPLHPCVYLLS